MKKTSITVVGSGYVGLSNAVLLSQKNNVTIYDIDTDRVDLINQKIPTIEDKDISYYFEEKKLNLRATSCKKKAYKDADFFIVATPTDYNTESNYFDTSSVESTISDILSINTRATIIIKSTIPVGFTELVKDKFSFKKIIFSPEFLREGKALYDNLNPSRVIIGDKSEEAVIFSNLLTEAATKKNIITIYTGSTEAEAIKLFSNSYLAMRVAFFNELDSYAYTNNLDTKEIIEGMCLDPRIGSKYNNPSFGYGGYCLPKDTKQLLTEFDNVPNNIIRAIVESNSTRMNFISDIILRRKPKIVGVYRLIMKSGSDNFRASSIQHIISRLKEQGVEIKIYEPGIDQSHFMNSEIIKDLQFFKSISEVILANRMSDSLLSVEEKVFTRDLFGTS